MNRIELELTAFGTTRLGSLIEAIKQQPGDSPVSFDFCYLVPAGIASYRGYYEHLALGWTDGGSMSANDMRQLLAEADGKVYEGWKGGNYRMSRYTPVWVDNRGEYSSTAIVAVEIDHRIRLITKALD